MVELLRVKQVVVLLIWFSIIKLREKFVKYYYILINSR
jgi:hypothetical protein